VRAKLLAIEGDFDRARRHAVEAVELLTDTEFLNIRADRVVDLADVLVLAGRQDEAATALEDALERYVLKGNLVSAKRTRDALTALRAAR
jgi:hypothetical protein